MGQLCIVGSFGVEELMIVMSPTQIKATERVRGGRVYVVKACFLNGGVNWPLIGSIQRPRLAIALPVRHFGTLLYVILWLWRLRMVARTSRCITSSVALFLLHADRTLYPGS